MFKIIFLTAFVWLIVGGLFTIWSFFSFDRLLRQIMAESETSWVELGKPIGFFWIPPGATDVTAGGFVRGELYRKWATDHLMTSVGSKEAIAKLRWFKQIGGICIIVGLLQLLGSVAMLFAE